MSRAMELDAIGNSSLRLNITVEAKLPVADFCLQWPNVTFEIGSTGTPYIVNAVFNSFFAVLATISNSLVFLVIRKSTSLHLPSKILLGSLIMTDLGVGLIGQPSFVIFLTAKAKRLADIMCVSLNVASFVGSSLSGASMLTMTLMSADRFIAFHFHLQYRRIVTVRRVCVALASAWLVSAFAASLWLWSVDYFYIVSPLSVGLCNLVTSLAYLSIYRGLRRRNITQRVDTEAHVPSGQHQAQHPATNASNYRKSASAMFWAYLIFVLCYLPFVCCVLLVRITGMNFMKRNIFEICQTIFLLNSSINPNVYCWRIPDIRAGVLKRVRPKLCA